MTEHPTDSGISIRPYEGSTDADGLWTLKRGFELGIGEGTGGEEKGGIYEEKLTAAYRRRWLDWVERCVSEDPECVIVAVDEAGAETDAEAEADPEARGKADLVGYAFVLPETLSFIWDAAVLNEVFVASDYRGSGVADDLMDAVLACARSQDLPLDRLVLDVDRENDRARAFYDRYGFEHWAEMVAREL
ncbi:GNAT family N-acetyltransferase [Halobellus rufus]|uniref:GNAT family N-acetyltransferase n=1 Tax=Halobellus rufus TaxID=1448860 RepID=UPI000678E795|nr:GNAT family N-acetyltransferase [Halobellus rufus]